MVIKGERGLDPAPAHDIKAGAIDQAELPVVGRQQRLDNSLVGEGVNPLDLEQRREGLTVIAAVCVQQGIQTGRAAIDFQAA